MASLIEWFRNGDRIRRLERLQKEIDRQRAANLEWSRREHEDRNTFGRDHASCGWCYTAELDGRIADAVVR